MDLGIQRYRTAREPFWALASQLVTSGANFATSVIIIHGANLAIFGRYSLCFLLVMMIRKFLIGVVLTPMSSIMPTIDSGRSREYRLFLIIYAAVFAIFSGLFVWTISHPLAILFSTPWLPSIAIPLFFANSAVNYADFLRRLHLDSLRPIQSFMVDATRFTIQIGILLGLAVFQPEDLTAKAALWIWGGSALLGCGAGLYRIGQLKFAINAFKDFWIRHRAFVGWMSSSMLLDAIQNNLPMFIATSLVGESALGALRALQQFANLLNLPFNALMQVMPSMAAQRYAASGIARMRDFLVRMTAVSVLAITLLALAIVLVSDLIINQALGLHGNDVVPIFIAFVCLNILTLVRLPFFVAFSTIGKLRPLTTSNLASAFIAIIGTALWVRDMGPIAVPAFMTIGHLLSMVFLLFTRDAMALRTVK
ncbi:lipopolysaccharide biosynthesis protein [Novosphingobium mangrovi (ex Huang et al. 2023)]|uniref:Polysaccharide biosynthesis protein C-terminal domain-containing protein n=1 Tax=Novosphingobium mangrovi (ex Huang et al. 2023) TaxID=2976432 RepID=A0ABT2I0C3_9SPHN|nr:hypothetical protein [Novosphingobium mangrovi (ex Huang et al. 2023)]MCT2398067.1 hypothetical protein [Novosphingobium mangrovi (ex Huang et al. 2023)]